MKVSKLKLPIEYKLNFIEEKMKFECEKFSLDVSKMEIGEIVVCSPGIKLSIEKSDYSFQENEFFVGVMFGSEFIAFES
jgi:hypothetical protein